jgi:ferredoxin-NADP reductase
VEDLLRKYADGFNIKNDNAIAYLCGHPQMILNAKSILLRARFREDQIKQEAYFPLELQD